MAPRPLAGRGARRSWPPASRPRGGATRARRAARRASVCDAVVDRLDADPVEEAQADLDGGQVEVVDGAVLEVRRARGGLVPLALDEGGDDRAAGEPGPLELGQRLAAREQAADAGRPAEHLVEGEGDEVRVPAAEVEPVGRHVGGGVEEHVPAVRVRLLDPVERVLDAGEVRLGRVGEQVVVLAADLGQVARQQRLVDAQVGRRRSARRSSRRRGRGRTRGCR